MCQRIGNYFETLGKDPSQYLHACEVSTEQFQYSKVSCDQMGFHSEIPYPDASFDIVYAVEVLEHTQRPYHFIDEAFRALAPGGTLIFSVPNILQLNARVNFLLSGFPDFFGPPQPQTKMPVVSAATSCHSDTPILSMACAEQVSPESRSARTAAKGALGSFTILCFLS